MVVIFLVRAIADLINLLLNTRRKDLNFHTYIELSSFNLARDASSYAFYHINILQTHAQRLVDWTLRCAKFLQSHKQWRFIILNTAGMAPPELPKSVRFKIFSWNICLISIVNHWANGHKLHVLETHFAEVRAKLWLYSSILHLSIVLCHRDTNIVSLYILFAVKDVYCDYDLSYTHSLGTSCKLFRLTHCVRVFIEFQILINGTLTSLNDKYGSIGLADAPHRISKALVAPRRIDQQECAIFLNSCKIIEVQVEGQAAISFRFVSHTTQVRKETVWIIITICMRTSTVLKLPKMF